VTRQELHEALRACGLVAIDPLVAESREIDDGDIAAVEKLHTMLFGEITIADLEAEPMLQLFGWAHLPPHLAARSAPFGRLALHVVRTTPRNPERTVALRKLREAKDCTVTAHVWQHYAPPVPSGDFVVTKGAT
jgi:hypothetical protein